MPGSAQRRLAEENEVMSEIGRIINSSLDINEVYELFAAELAKLITFEWAGVSLLNTDESTLTVTYVSGNPIAHRKYGDIIPLTGTFSEAVIEDPVGLLVDASQGEDHLRFPVLAPG